MNDAERAQYEGQSKELRATLKRWENDWAKNHDGKKPGREDIKAHPEIARIYKSYNKVRGILSGKIATETPTERQHRHHHRHEIRPLKRKSPDPPPAQTPSKRPRTADKTPSTARQYNPDVDTAVTPSLSRKLFSPPQITSIGPTPQRDGKVLGLFDLLPPEDANMPSKTTGTQNLRSEEPRTIAATPSKPRPTTADDLDAETPCRHTRTPMSASKRNLLDSFTTPLKKRDPNAFGNANKTPSSSASKLNQFATPAFLKRRGTAAAPVPPVDENGEFIEPDPIFRRPRKPLMRSLSSMVAGLRKMQEEELDEDLEALHEMENEERGQPARKFGPKSAAETQAQADEVLVEDSQTRPQLLGGFDDEAMYDSPEEEPLGLDGKPLRVYKKKGQKRQTRRVNMKPVRTKRPSPVAEEHEGADSDDGDGDVVPETQVDASEQHAKGHDKDQDPALLSGSEFAGSDGENEQPETAEKKKKKRGRPPKKESHLKKAARKVNELAHANFRRLKLRNNGAKGGPGYNSRFRRRR